MLSRALVSCCVVLAYIFSSINNSATVAAQQATSVPRSLIEELREYAYRLNAAYSSGTESDLAPILAAVGNAKIIAMGEATHGTGDFFAMKGRIFRYLAEHDGVRVLAMEANWADGQVIDSYLQTGNGNLSKILRRTWNYQEVLELLQWMRRYNEVHPHALHFFGMDMQQPDTAIPYILSYDRTFDPGSVDAITQALTCINKPTMLLFTKELSNANQCINNTRAVVQQLIDERHGQTTEDRGAYLTAFHASELVEEAAIEYAKSNIEEKAATRDLAMAHNVEWLSTTLYPASKVFIWAHNDHIAVGLEAWPSMGTILRESYGADYFAIGQTFDHGKVAEAQMEAADVSPAAPGTSEVAVSKNGDCWAASKQGPSKGYKTVLIYFQGCAGSGQTTTHYKNPDSGGLDIDKSGNLVSISYSTPAVYVYSGCKPVCKLIGGPFTLKGTAVYGHLNKDSTRFATADYEYGQVDIYTYSPTAVTYRYSFNNGISVSSGIVGAAYNPRSKE
jgi:erythromycin esterase